MATDQLEACEQSNDACGKLEALRDSARWSDRTWFATKFLVPVSGSGVAPPASSARIEADDRQQRDPCPGVEPESDLEAMLELETAEPVVTEPIRAADPPDPVQIEERFPYQEEGVGGWVDPQAPDSATGSVLGLIGKMIDRPQHFPLSDAPEGKVPVKLPKQVGRYRIHEQLGKGAMGAIYLAHDTQLGRRVALKVPHLRPGEDGATPDRCDLDRFFHEARAAATLDHPNLCPVYDAGQIDGIPYITMAYIKGRPLSKYIQRDRPMSQRRVVIMARKLAQALEEAHFKGVVHRDLKPSNIMVNTRGDLIVMDFGLVWRIGAQKERLTRVGQVVGTPSYMSPEQVSGRMEDIGPCCDIYSLGVIMYELLTGRLPYEGPEAVVLGQILFFEPAPPSSLRPDLDPRLEAICLKAMAKNLQVRYATMGELAMALGDYLRSANDATRALDLGPPGVAAGGADAAAQAIAQEGAAEPSPRSEETAEVETGGLELSIEVPEPTTLWKAWRQWTVIVEHFALRRSYHYVNRIIYDNLYKTLVKSCRARAAKAQGPRQEFYRRLEDFVLPWMTPTVLESTDREILFSVLSFCRQFEQELLDQTELLPEPGDGFGRRFRQGLLNLGLLVAAFVGVLIWSYWAG